MTAHHPLVPILLSGGTGTRLWPVSRETHPKPFMTLPDGQSLLQKTYQRVCELPHVRHLITVTNKDYYLKSTAAYAAVNTATTPTMQFLLEPAGRNTAPAIALAALKVAAEFGEEAVLLVLPSDHLIPDSEAFAAEVEKAYQLATAGKIVTFGVLPHCAETGFGYIHCGESYAETSDAFHVKAFVEKPNAALAASYVASKEYLWNVGIFCFRADVMLEQFALLAPALFQEARRCWEATQQHAQGRVMELDATTFEAMENISIDYAIMEKLQEIAVIACHFDWHDIGSWEAYKALFTPDEHGNTVLGEAVMIDAANNLVQSEGRMIAAVGVDDLAIIDTPDALLVARRDRLQDVKQVVQQLKQQAHDSYLIHRTVQRPWGSYTILEEGVGFKIKHIEVHPGASLSLQRHRHRSEHWVVVSGVATVINGDRHYELRRNESTFVPIGAEHRLSNNEPTELIIIEVQTGQYLGEDDIIRIEDTYGRVTS